MKVTELKADNPENWHFADFAIFLHFYETSAKTLRNGY